MPVSKVYMTCNAYESGVGHGVEGDNLPNPFASGTDEHEAYDLGYQEGRNIIKEDSPGARNILICGGISNKESALLHVIRDIGFENIIIADDNREPFELNTLEYRLPDACSTPIYRESNAKRCGYSTKRK